MKTIGIDIGGVIITPAETAGDTSFFSDDYLDTPAIEKAFEGINQLRGAFFGEAAVHLVSKCGPAIQQKTLNWLDHHSFYSRTGVRPENVHFCRERKDKAPICDKLCIDTFIDDRLSVLAHMGNVKNRIHFCASERARKESQNSSLNLGKYTLLSWEEVVQFISENRNDHH